MEKKKYRHELKHYINIADCMELRSRLKIIAKLDENAGDDGCYKIRSLYFDNYSDKAVVEKLAGVSRREKFRIRYYNDDISFIRLEKKSKVNRLCTKDSMPLTKELCGSIINCQYDFLKGYGAPLLWELYTKVYSEQLRPKNVVDYTREAYIFNAGNVRITIDSDIRTSNNVFDFLNPHSVTTPAANAIILEIKFDNFLPDVIRDMIQINNRHETEFSKYVVARLV